MGAWVQGKTDEALVDNIFNYFLRELVGDTSAAIQQTVQATGVDHSTLYKIRSEAKSTHHANKSV